MAVNAATVIGWLVCSVLSYLLLRVTLRSITGKWTAGDRVLGILFSFLGPICLFAAVIVYVITRAVANDTDAKW